jgi:hypothetical protein
MRMTPRFSISWSWSAFAGSRREETSGPGQCDQQFFMMFTRYVSMKQKIL